MKREQVEKVQEILGPRFKRNFWSHLRPFLTYRAQKDRVSDADISRIIAQLLSSQLYPKIQERNGYLYIHVASRIRTERRPKVWINIALFFLTVITTLMAGSMLSGWEYFTDFSLILHGWKYSFAVLTILTAHEMGHYLAARYHKMNVTLPYYIPLPLPGFNFGTLGAFIKIRSPIPHRRALLQVGAFGPLAGFVVSLVFLAIGYAWLPDFKGIVAYVEKIHPWDMQGQGVDLVMGKSLLFAFFNDVLAGGRLPMNEIYHFPFIFAGWIGLLVTAINLLPIGQLDGGHILYALIGKKARIAGISAFVLMLILNFFLIFRFFSFVWVVWILLIFVLIGFRHPPTVDETVELTAVQKYIGWFCLVLFILCFSPLPVYVK